MSFETRTFVGGKEKKKEKGGIDLPPAGPSRDKTVVIELCQPGWVGWCASLSDRLERFLLCRVCVCVCRGLVGRLISAAEILHSRECVPLSLSLSFC